VGLLLLLPVVRDCRAVLLAGFFLVAATAFVDPPLALALNGLHGGVRALFQLLAKVQPIPFMPFLLAAFLREFPRRPRVARNYYFADWILRLLAGLGIVLMALKVLIGIVGERPATYLLWADQLFIILILAPSLAALVLLVARGRLAEGEERRRVMLFCLALFAGLGPMIVTAVWEILGPGSYFAFLKHHLQGVITLVTLGILSLPFTMAYSVLVNRVFDMRVVARRAVHYALARNSVTAVVSVPLFALGFYLFRRQDETVRQILSGKRFILLSLAAFLGFWALKFRPRLLEAVDRHFFREQYNARAVLTSLAERIPRATQAAELADLILPGIERALHPESLFFLVEDPRRGALIDPTNPDRRLDVTTRLAQEIAGRSEPLVLDLEDPRSHAARLPESDRRWLAEAGVELCVPIVAVDGALLAVLALAAKKSGLPFLREDRALLSAIANSAAPVLELQRIRRTATVELPIAGTLSPEWGPARECPQCGQVFLPQTVFCAACDQRLETAGIPYSIPGKLRFERRIGVGGMGVVYRAADIGLGRPVAVKTLRRVSAEQATRLRREARTAAAVSHQNLAAIYGVESWRGMPMLLLELFEGGTLALRLSQAPLAIGEVLELGSALADALAQLHAADILHRDIKPSNIGYSRDGVPKLTDFGIARFIYDLDRDLLRSAEEERAQVPFSIWNLPRTEESAEKLRGTLPYLSPEAIEGQPPDASFDLWSLSIVLYESLTGRKIFSGQDPKQMMRRLLLARLPDLRQFLPEAPQAAVELFHGLLNRDRRQRPQSAAELRARLEETRARLALAEAAGSQAP
jgi:hypothetical protein